MRLSASRGTRDIKEEEARLFRELEETARTVFDRYGLEDIRTPVFETAELFQRAVGESTDIVEKEMYVFEDRGGRRLALRPEGTAGVVRAYLEHSWDKTGGRKKLFYMGPMFRADRPQAGRYREFWQIGAEIFGNPHPQADYLLLVVLREILTEFGLKDVRFFLNSIGCSECRPVYRKALVDYLEKRRAGLCEDCQRRIDKNPMRVLDCKIDGSKLADAPMPADFLCAKCRAHDEALSALLSRGRFPHERKKNLVRGLDYYSRTVFEVTSQVLGAQDALAAGGRYDALVKLLGGPDTAAIGFALGMDRVARARGPRPAEKAEKVFVAVAGEAAAFYGFSILDVLRGRYPADIGSPGDSLKSQMRYADSWGASHVIIVGDDEEKKGTAILKNLAGHEQKEIPWSDLKNMIEKKSLSAVAP